MSAQRLKRLVIDPESLGGLFMSGKKFQCLTGLPPTATFVGHFQYPSPGKGLLLNLVYEDPSFGEVPDGGEIPMLPAPVIRSFQDREGELGSEARAMAIPSRDVAGCEPF